MEEKRKLEKIIFADLDKAKHDYDQKHDAERAKILEAKAQSKEAKAILADYLANEKEKQSIEKRLEANGLCTTRGGNYSDSIRPTIIQANGKGKEIEELNKKIRTGKDKLDSMKRTYTLKLFASGQEAQEVFESLQNEIAKILN